MSNLQIYKASAGSGKTYTLVKSLMVFLIRSPGNFDKILAITFTNKAAGEMKERVLKRLFETGQGKDQEYIKMLISETGFGSEQVIRNAKAVFKNILHRYGRFQIGTIDSFFQKILRSFAKELDLSFNYNLELDERTVLKEVADKVMEKAGQEKLITEWLLQFMMSGLDEGKNWDISRELPGFGVQLFSEPFRQNANSYSSTNHKEIIKKLRSGLNVIIHNFENQMKSEAETGLTILKAQDLSVSDLKYGKGSVANYLNKIINKTSYRDFQPGVRVLKAINREEDIFTESNPLKVSIQAAVENGFLESLNNCTQIYEKQFITYFSAIKSITNLYHLGILDDMDLELKNYRDTNRVLLISDTNRILNEVTGKQAVPFIYEKTGSHFRFYLLDEFQDTSDHQWKNLKPLILEALATGNQVLVVGDTKQSIYRWRGGNMKLLNNQLEDDLAVYKENIEIIDLEHNRRSKKNIVNFNNWLFSMIPQILGNNFEGLDMAMDLENLFSNAVQSIPENQSAEGGEIYLEWLEEGELGWKNQAMEKTALFIEKQLGLGYQLMDIAILTETNQEGILIADYLMTHFPDYKVLSPDALQIGQNQKIRLIILCIKWLANPDDRILMNAITRNYTQIKSNSIIHNWDPVFRSGEDFTEWLHSISGRNLKANLLTSGIKEITIEWCNLLGFNQINDAYITQLLDTVSSYSNRYGGSPRGFLEWWETTGHRESISMPETMNAIKVMTVHKAKGLEFPIVCVPFLKFGFKHRIQPLLWIKSNQPPFSDLPYLPVKYFNYNYPSLFETDMKKEFMEMVLDKLNLLYVAFTRPMDKLNVFLPHPSNKKGSKQIKTVPELITTALNKQMELPEFNNYWKEDQSVYHIEETVQAKEEDNTTFSPEIEYPELEFNNDWVNRFSLGAGNFNFQNKRSVRFMEWGKKVHKLLSQINYYQTDLFELNRLMKNYHLESGETEIMKTTVENLLSHPITGEWFDNQNKIWTEKEILMPDGNIQRPDRIVFKPNQTVIAEFKTGQIEDRDKTQIQDYCHTVSKMGFPDVKGYLIYLNRKTGALEILEN